MTATQSAPSTAAASWPPGLPRSLDYPAVPVGSILRAAARRWGDRTAFLDHDVPLTYTELGRRAHAVAGWLADHGIGRGDVVAVHLPNCRQYPPLYYGILLAGATFSPTNPLLPAPELAAQLTDAGANARGHLGPGAALRPRRAGRDPGETVVVTGEAHTLDFAARLEGLADDAADWSTWPTCSAATPPTGISTPTSTSPRPRAPGLHRRHDRGQQGRGAAAPHRRHQRAAVGLLDVGLDARARRGRRRDDPPGGRRGGVPGPARRGRDRQPHPVVPRDGRDRLPQRPGHGRDDDDHPHALRPGEATSRTPSRHRVTSIGGAPPVFVALLQVPGIEDADLSRVRGVSSGAAPAARCR